MVLSAVIDGCVLHGDEATISVADDGLLRGDGVFEVVRLYDGRAWALGEHLERMEVSARNLRLPFSRSAFSRDVESLVDAVAPGDALLRLVLTRAGRRIGIVEEISSGPGTIALATVVYELPGLLDGIKSLSYAANMLAPRLAREQEADDALFVSLDGMVLEASRASFFYVYEGELCTPPIERGVLDSITRRHLLRLGHAVERPIDVARLPNVVEAFVASTTKEVLPVHSIDGTRLAAPGPQTLAAERAFIDYVRSQLGLAPRRSP